MRLFYQTVSVFFLSFFLFAEIDDLSLRGKEYDSNTRMAQIYLERARQRKAAGDEDMANADFEKAFKFDPSLASVHSDLRISNQAAEWIKKADNTFYPGEKITCYEKAIQCDDRCGQAYFLISKTYYKQKKYEKTIEYLNLLIGFDSAYPGAKALLSKAEKKLSKKKKS